MALSQRGNQRFSAAIWPGYVDALSTLLLVLTFVLTIFMVIQFALRDRITTQDTELDALNAQVAGLAEALGLEEGRSAALALDLGTAQADAAAKSELIATLTAQVADRDAALTEARGAITSFEAQVASLLAERDAARGEGERLGAALADSEAAKAQLLSDQEALNLALAKARDEIDAGAEAARLAAARRDALMALAEDLRRRNAETGAALSEADAARLVEAEAARALRDKLASADAELTAMTLALEEERKRAEETLTLLAAADSARKNLDTRLAAAVLASQASAAEIEALRAGLGQDKAALEDQLAEALAARLAAEQDRERTLTEAEARAALLAAAEAALAQETRQSEEGQRRIALLNQQVAALGAQLSSLQSLIDASAAKDSNTAVQIETLGSQLNAALAQVASEQKRRAALEEAERKRLEEEARQLARYRSEFFGKLSEVLEGREGIRVVGDRFVFSSEVLFEPGAADLSGAGRDQIARVAGLLGEVAGDIPPEIDWIIRVDGHTDNEPLSGLGEYADNWELSQARALSVVRYMTDELGFAPRRLAATGFGEFQPVAPGDSDEARAQNRRIELKLTER